MGQSDDKCKTELKRKMRIVYAFALIAMTTFLMAASVTAMSEAIR